MRYDVHYCSTLAIAEAGKAPGDDVAGLGEFDRFYRYIGTFEAPSLDELAAKLQNGGGGLGDKTMQHFVIRRVQHTSMTVGDIAIERDTGRIWFAALMGWKQLQLR